ncbi:MAG: CarD family transcriptional regulator [Ruminococcus sp.]|nr:CarD family transcriptional regulator [Ruminococcus sp.]MBQ1686712.1 CarD family transcriptional regulator [Ruminococcus sp.]MBQ5687346.1 CarD family transcriptional regulator [Ruminococcus sp.]MEE0953381.1 CarD family transcriptional regulator [Ruminococcus sp.]
MFCVGQTVLYGSNGVCMVDDVTEKRIGKTKMQYYVLKPLCNNTSTLFVPTANQQLVSKMRRILTEDEAEAILRDLPPCGDWNDNKQERSEQFRAIITEGSCVELIRLIRLVRTHGQEQLAGGKRLHISDERFLKEAEKMICEEFSLVLHISRDEVLERILQ